MLNLKMRFLDEFRDPCITIFAQQYVILLSQINNYKNQKTEK